jgi:hypothetical protein
MTPSRKTREDRAPNEPHLVLRGSVCLCGSSTCLCGGSTCLCGSSPCLCGGSPCLCRSSTPCAICWWTTSPIARRARLLPGFTLQEQPLSLSEQPLTLWGSPCLCGSSTPCAICWWTTSPIARRARLLQGFTLQEQPLSLSEQPLTLWEQHLSLWEQHPVRDLLVDHQPHRAQGAAPTGDRGSAADDAAELGAGIDAEFAENGAHMGVHRAGRDAQANGDFFVGVAAGDEFEHVGLAL